MIIISEWLLYGLAIRKDGYICCMSGWWGSRLEPDWSLLWLAGSNPVCSVYILCPWCNWYHSSLQNCKIKVRILTDVFYGSDWSLLWLAGSNPVCSVYILCPWCNWYHSSLQNCKIKVRILTDVFYGSVTDYGDRADCKSAAFGIEWVRLPPGPLSQKRNKI